MIRRALATAALLLPACVATAEPPDRVVVWAPGYPGSSEQATRAMEDLAGALAEASAGVWAPTLVYEPSLDDGRALVAADETVAAIVPAPVLAAFGEDLGLEPVLRIRTTDGSGEEVWSLVAALGRVSGPQSLEGWEIHGLAGLAPQYVRGRLLAEWGELPPTTEIVFSSRLRSALRRAAQGEKIAVLLDLAQTEALPALPFAGDLEVVARSREQPSSYFCSVRGALAGERLASARAALMGVGETSRGREALSAVKIESFVAIEGRP